MRLAAAALAAALLMAGAAHAEIVIGVAVPSDGPKAELAKVIREAAVRAAAIPVLGDGEAIRLEIADDECSAEGGAVAAAKFVAAKVALVIGHPCANAAVAAAKIYARAGMVLVAIGPRHPELTAKRAGPTIFRLGGRDDRQAADTVAVYVPILLGERVAVVHDRTAYAKGLAEAVAAGFRAHGVPDVVIEPIVAGERDYDGLVGKLKVSSVKAVYFAGFPTEAALIFDGLERSGVVARFMGCDALAGMQRRWLSVMSQRQLEPAEVESAVSHVVSAAVEASRGGDPLARAVAKLFDAGGDDAVPSYLPHPFPLK